MDAMTDFLTGYEVATGAGLGGDPGLKASRQSTGGALSVFETSIDAGPPLHVHDREDECFSVLDGSLSVRCGGDEFHAAAGSFVFLPRDINAAGSPEEQARIGDRFGIRVVPG
jgi:mannose-6-phosphate isomerase-like protein (cupin superfamily)